MCHLLCQPLTDKLRQYSVLINQVAAVLAGALSSRLLKTEQGRLGLRSRSQAPCLAHAAGGSGGLAGLPHPRKAQQDRARLSDTHICRTVINACHLKHHVQALSRRQPKPGWPWVVGGMGHIGPHRAPSLGSRPFGYVCGLEISSYTSPWPTSGHRGTQSTVTLPRPSPGDGMVQAFWSFGRRSTSGLLNGSWKETWGSFRDVSSSSRPVQEPATARDDRDLRGHHTPILVALPYQPCWESTWCAFRKEMHTTSHSMGGQRSPR